MSAWSRALLAAAVFVAALAPRASTWSGTFESGVVLLEEVDPYHHLRRIELALANGLVPPSVDTYNNHPTGAVVDWPPGFDVGLALAWHLYSRALPEPAAPAAFGAVAVAVLGSMAAAALALFVARWGLLAGLAAGLALAWSPAAVAYSRVGRLDHHAIEPLCLVALCAAYAWSRRRASPARAATLGVLLSLTTVFWIMSAFYAAALALPVALESWTRREALARHGAIAFGAAAATSSILALLSPWGRELEVVYYALSWFQPLVFASLALGFLAVHRTEAGGRDRRRAWAVGGMVLTVGIALLLVSSDTLGRGFAFLLAEDPGAKTLVESRSLADTGAAYALAWLGPVGLALPLLLVSAVVIATRRNLIDAPLAAGVAMALPALLLGLLQVRFGPHAAVASALLAGWLIGRVERPAIAAGTVAALAGLSAWVVRPSTLPDSMVHPYLLGGFDALVWLRQAPPPTSHYRRPTEPPEYAVAAEWVWGHWITQIGQKPNVANPLGQSPTHLRGSEEIALLFLEESEEDALARMERLDVRYLLLSAIPVTVTDLARLAGRDPERYVTRDADGRDTFLPAFFDTFHTRLYVGGGAGQHETAPLSGVRLVFESRSRIEFLGARSAVRIFEVVPGATLVGRCDANSVEARARPDGTDVVLTVRTVPDPNGAFALTVPYSSEPTPASIRARVVVHCGAEEIPVEISERDVLEGRTVAVPGLATPGRAGLSSRSPVTRGPTAFRAGGETP